MNSSAPLVRHYWSLSAEEQFYLVWPLALIGLYLLAIRKMWDARRVLMAGLGVAVVTSLALAFS